MSGIPTNGLRKKENITKGVRRENTHTESVQSQKIQSSPIMEISRQRMPHFRRGRRKNLPTEKYRRLLISQKRTAGSYRRQRTRCRKSGSMRWNVSLMNRPEKQSMWWFRWKWRSHSSLTDLEKLRFTNSRPKICILCIERLQRQKRIILLWRVHIRQNSVQKMFTITWNITARARHRESVID